MDYPHKFQRDLLEPLLSDKGILNFVNYLNTSVHVAILVKRGQIISVATNKLGTRSRGAAYSFVTIHAEKNCIKQLGNLNDLKGAQMYVVRIPKITPIDHYGNESEKKFLKSKPCNGCQKFLEKCIKQYGLSKVYYSDGTGCNGPSKSSLCASDPALRCTNSCKDGLARTTCGKGGSDSSSAKNKPKALSPREDLIASRKNTYGKPYKH